MRDTHGSRKLQIFRNENASRELPIYKRRDSLSERRLARVLNRLKVDLIIRSTNEITFHIVCYVPHTFLPYRPFYSLSPKKFRVTNICPESYERLHISHFYWRNICRYFCVRVMSRQIFQTCEWSILSLYKERCSSDQISWDLWSH